MHTLLAARPSLETTLILNFPEVGGVCCDLVVFCSNLLQEADPCDFGIPPGIDVAETSVMPPNSQRFGFYLTNTGESLITASLAIFVDDASLVYVAHGGVIDVVSILL